jgi:hypothetical protein
MSRSKKEPVVRDSPRNTKKSTMYWRHVRKGIKQAVRKLFYNEETEIPNPKTIVNDYTREDYSFRAFTQEQKEKWSRK